MSKKKKEILYTIGGVIVVLPLVVLIIGVIGYLRLPSYIEKEILPGLEKDYNLKIKGEVRRLGMSGADISEVTIGQDETGQAIEVDSLRLNYGVETLLFDRHIDRISLSGITINCQLKDGALVFPGIDLAAFSAAQGQGSGTSGAEGEAPISFGEIEIGNAVLVVDVYGRKHRIPFEMEITPEKNWQQIAVNGKLFPRGEQLEFKWQVNPADKKVVGDLSFKGIELERFSDLIHSVADGRMAGKASMALHLQMGMDPVRVSKLEGDITVADADIQVAGVTISGAGKQQEFRTRITGTGEAVDVLISGIRVEKPAVVTIPTAFIKLVKSEAGLMVSGDLAPDILSLPEHLGIRLKEPFTMPLEYVASVSKGKSRIDLAIKPVSDTEKGYLLQLLDSSGNQMSGRLRQFRCQASAGKTIQGETNINLIDLSCGKRSKRQGYDYSISSNAASLNVKFFQNGKGENSLKSEMTLSKIAANQGNWQVGIPGIKCSAEAKSGKSMTGVVKVSVPAFAEKSHKIAVKNINLELPWDSSGRCNRSGKFSVTSARYGKLDLGKIDIDLQQIGARSLMFAGVNESGLLEKLAIELEGSVEAETGAPVVKVNYRIPEHRAKKPIDLGSLFESGKGIEWQGALRVNGKLIHTAQGNQASCHVMVRDGLLNMPASDAEISGITLDFQLADVLTMRSSPKQHLEFKKLKLGDWSFTDGKIDFQTESGKSLLIERCQLKWCKGQVYTQAFRIVPGKHEYDVTFYCDRVRLAPVVSFFTMMSMEGGGEVSGRFPFKFSKGKLSCQDAFLFTTPGETGNFKLEGMDSSIEAASEGQPDPIKNQLLMTKAALRDFNYRWAKLYFDPNQDQVNLRLRFEGRPAKPIPFKIQNGQFVKVSVEGEGMMRDMKLDLNFNNLVLFNSLPKVFMGVKGKWAQVLDHFKKALGTK